MHFARQDNQLRRFIVAAVFISVFGGLGGATVVDGQTPDDPKGIYLYDLTTMTRRTLATGAGYYGYPHISGRYVIWTEGPSSPGELYLHDLVEGTTQRVPSEPHVITADVDGQRIVWFEIASDLRARVHLYDISKRHTREIAKVPVVYAGPIVRGDVVVWADYNQGQGDIFLYDIGSGQQRQITRQEPSDAASYRNATKYLGFDGARVAWISSTTETRQTPAQSSLHVYDVARAAETSIPLPRFIYSDVAIAGDRVVWGGQIAPLSLTEVSGGTYRVLLDQMEVHSVEFDGSRVVCEVMLKGGEGRGYNKDIFLIDVGTDNVTRLSDTPGIERHPDIDGRYVVWMVE